ncbi:MAG: ATP synthase F0 subunit C [Candidatus Scatomorpha sp.]|jgi:F-type H+-transporting ATPase subunit c
MRYAKRIAIIIFAVMTAVLLSAFAYADGGEAAPAQAAETAAETVQGADTNTGMKALAVGIAIGLAAAGGAVGMGMVGGKAADGISRQPEMEGKIRTTLMLDLVFIETAIIYALLVVILVIFVL